MRQSQALHLMSEGRSVFLTGAPGAGKTYVLNQFIELARRQGKRVAVTASTGIAATHIGGTTIHSWSGLGIKDFLSDYDMVKITASSKLIKRYNATDILIVDEVSMLHGVRLDLVNKVAKALRQNDRPFGGLQVVLVGDLFQLPPVSRGTTDADFVHLCAAWRELNPAICYLSEQHRQTGGDRLLDLLEAMREGHVEDVHEAALAERLEQYPDQDAVVTRLYAHNVDVDRINQTHLDAIDEKPRRYQMSSGGASPKVEQLMKSVLAPERLELKHGAEVMFVANDFTKGFVNGSRGRIVGFDGSTPVVELASGKEIRVEPHSWNLEEDGRVRAEVSQLPLRLAWAITIHKSQGMSLDAAEIDLSRTFTPGMGYVALSRVRNMSGVYLRGVNRMALAMHPRIHEFDLLLRQATQILSEITPDFTETVNADEVKSAVNEELFQKLRAWRTAQAATEKNAPYMVLHDTTLRQLAARCPRTEQALLGIKGLGKTKVEKYGPKLIEICQSP